MANTYLYKAQPGVGSSIKSTFSGWIKLANDNLTGGIYGQYYNANYNFDICLQTGNLEVADYLVNQYKMRKRTTQKLRDLNAWYHIYVAIDRSLSTAADRTKVYINGERVTDFQSAEDANYTQQTSGSHDGNCKMNNLGGSTDFSRVGIRYDGNEFDGSMSHIYWIDGSVIDIAQFGSTDSTTGEWKINTNPTIASFGQTGFLCLKDGNTITDQSPNSNNFTSSGSGVTKTEDCPSNVFCTWNPFTNFYANATFSNGNNTVFFNNTNEKHILATLGMNSGKFYWESKLVSHSGNSLAKVGIESSLHNDAGGYAVDSYGYRGEGGGGGGATNSGRKVNNGTFTNWGSSYTAGDIIGCAVDLDNNKIYFSKNGTWQESGDPTSGSTGTGSAFNLIAPVSGFYHPSIGKEASATATWSMNFGNGYFGTTAVSSAGTNASGNGIFEYDVPTGYTALSTKGLNT